MINFIEVTTSCGHKFRAPNYWVPYLEEGTLNGATFDCPDCGRLEIINGCDGYQVTSQDFHKWMHDKGPDPATGLQWPADGSGTGYVEIVT